VDQEEGGFTLFPGNSLRLTAISKHTAKRTQNRGRGRGEGVEHARFKGHGVVPAWRNKESTDTQTHTHTHRHTDTHPHTHTHTHTQTPMTHSFQLFAGSDPSRPSFARNPLRTPWVQWQGNLQARCACHARGRDQWMMVGEGETRSAMAVAERQWGQSRPLPTDLGRSPACAGRCQMASCHALHC